MEQKTKNTLNNTLEGLLKRLEKGEKFVLAQAPAICKELVTEMIIDNARVLIFALTAIIGGIFVVNRTFIHQDDNVGFHFIGYLAITGGCIASVFLINNLLILKLCPKVSLMRKIKDLLSTSKG